jgi:hypothetical protein
MTTLKDAIASLESIQKGLYDGTTGSNNNAKGGLNNALITLRSQHPDVGRAIRELKHFITPSTTTTGMRALNRAIAVLQSVR